jgi:predicted DNA-binding transcriptional regulator YafY
MTVADLAEAWPVDGDIGARKRRVRRAIEALCRNPEPDDNAEGYGTGQIRELVVAVHVRGRPTRYFLDMAAVASVFMTDAMAMGVLLGQRLVNPALAASSVTQLKHAEVLAQARIEKTRDRFLNKLSTRLRIVPDGFDRLPAAIAPETLQECMHAVGYGKWISFTYSSASAGKTKKWTMGALGLVSKDGSVYLVCREDPDRKIYSLPLHRMTNVACTSRLYTPSPRFDIDAWLRQTGQMNHPRHDDAGPITLELSVAPESIFHFQERPLGLDQVITAPETKGGWFRLKVTTFHWYALTAFLASFGPYIRVEGPTSVLEGKDGILAWSRQMAAHYTASSAPG